MTDDAEGRSAGVGDLLLSHVLLALIITFILPTAVHLLNFAKLLSIPLGYYMAAQGCQVLLVTLAFYHAIRHDRIALAGVGGEKDPLGPAPTLRTVLFTILFAIVAIVLAYLADMSLSKGFERFGVGTALVIALIALVSAIGWVAKSTSTVSYPSGSSIGLGMDWLSGVAFIASVGAIYTMGYDGLAVGLGLVAGIVFHTTVIAPYEQTFATQSLPGFLAARLASRTVFFAAALIVAICAAVMLAAQIAAAGAILALMLGLDVSDATIAAALIVAVAALLYRAGDRSGDPRPALILTGLISLVAIFVPALLMALESTGLGLPHFTFGKALNEVSELQLSLLMEGTADPVTMTPYLRPFAHLSPFNFTALVLCVMLGAAAFPRAWASRARARSASGQGLQLNKQQSVTMASTRALHVAAWAALVVLLAMTTAPTVAAFTKAKIYAQLDGQLSLNTLPSWIYQLGSVGLLEVCGEAAKSVASVATACAGTTDVLRLQDLSISIGAIWLAAPLATGLPQFVLWLLMYAGLAAILAASIATLHTIYCSVHAGEIAQTAKATHTGLAFVASAVALVMASTVAYLAIGDVLTLLTWAFSLSAAGLAPVLIASIWWPRAVRATTAVIAMLIGFAMAGYYIVGTHFFAAHFAEVWRGLSNSAPYAFEEVADLLARCTPGAVTGETPPDQGGAASCNAIPSLERKLANWWGIKNSTAAIFGLPFGILVLLAAAIIAPRKKP